MFNGGLQLDDEDDSFLSRYETTDLRIVSDFLSNWLPFLSKGLCQHCSNCMNNRIQTINESEYALEQPHQHAESHMSTPYMIDNQMDYVSCNHGEYGVSGDIEESSGCDKFQSPESVKTPTLRRPWADMAHQELEADEVDWVTTPQKLELSREEKEIKRSALVNRYFTCFQRINGDVVNILEGLELHYNVFSSVEQKKIVDHVYKLQKMGENGELKERTFTAPPEWLKGKGRVTIQFGCCYNFATDSNGNPPGILYKEQVDPIPTLFKVIIKRLVAWHVLPPTCVPDTCIVDIYDEGDYIPPHIENHDFLRPFCSVSLLSECNILFGSNLIIEGPGEFSGSYEIPLPVGSVLVLKGNGADVAEHCMPAVPTKRISITFGKMDESKWPAGFHPEPEPDLQGLEPLVCESDTNKRFKHL